MLGLRLVALKCVEVERLAIAFARFPGQVIAHRLLQVLEPGAICCQKKECVAHQAWAGAAIVQVFGSGFDCCTFRVFRAVRLSGIDYHQSSFSFIGDLSVWNTGIYARKITFGPCFRFKSSPNLIKYIVV